MINEPINDAWRMIKIAAHHSGNQPSISKDSLSAAYGACINFDEVLRLVGIVHGRILTLNDLTTEAVMTEQTHDVVASVADLMPLDPSEAERKRELEKIVDENMVGFCAVGEALAEIRALKLYRPRETFEEYVAARFEMSRQRAYQLMAAAAARENVNACGHCILPANEAQARPLTLLPKADQPAVWGDVVERTAGIVTAKAVRQAVMEHLGRAARRRGQDVKDAAAADPELPVEFREAFAQMVELVQSARDQARDALRRYIRGLLNMLED